MIAAELVVSIRPLHTRFTVGAWMVAWTSIRSVAVMDRVFSAVTLAFSRMTTLVVAIGVILLIISPTTRVVAGRSRSGATLRVATPLAAATSSEPGPSLRDVKATSRIPAQPIRRALLMPRHRHSTRNGSVSSGSVPITHFTPRGMGSIGTTLTIEL